MFVDEYPSVINVPESGSVSFWDTIERMLRNMMAAGKYRKGRLSLKNNIVPVENMAIEISTAENPSSQIPSIAGNILMNLSEGFGLKNIFFRGQN